MDADAIVRALAESDVCAFSDGGWFHRCLLCDASVPVGTAGHAPDCPWRLAVEWVAAH